MRTCTKQPDSTLFLLGLSLCSKTKLRAGQRAFGLALHDNGCALYDNGLALYDDGLALYDNGCALYDNGSALYDNGCAGLYHMGLRLSGFLHQTGSLQLSPTLYAPIHA